MSCSLSLDPGLLGRQTLVYEARPPGFKAPLCSPLDVGPRASDFPSLAQFVTCEPGAPASQRGKAGKPESSFWHRVGLECYFRWAAPQEAFSGHPNPSQPRLHWPHFVVPVNAWPDICGFAHVPWAQHDPGFTLNACCVDKMDSLD